MTHFEMLLAFMGIFSVSIFFFGLGRLIQKLNDLDARTARAETLANEAQVSASGLQKSTVIQRVIEKYSLVPEASEPTEHAKKLEKELTDSILGLRNDAKEIKEREAKIMKASWDGNLKPEDLV